MMLTKTGRRWLTVNPENCDYGSSIVLILVNVTKPLGYRRQNKDRETRKNTQNLSWSTQFSQSRTCVCCNMLT